ncbi:MAG: LuxR C-terminal-related transcriptional regulator [Pseudomonadota bacterium]|nr:LuxR C-terminal-related transcriptional regulator [Pseudomonadota bacterium]
MAGIIAPSDPRYFQLIGEVARAIGTAHFHQRLLGLLGMLIAHDSAWIVRYSRNAPPDVIHTLSVAQHLVDFYLEHAYQRTDPFFCYWRSTDLSGVVLLRDALAAADDKDFYRDIFQRKARFSDEMALFLPALGKSCIALFIEKTSGQFSDHEAAVARIVFPTIEGLHRAHLANLFLALRCGGTPESRQLLILPTLIVDRAGASIHANAQWRKWDRSDPKVQTVRRKLAAGGLMHLELSQTAIMSVERFDHEFHLAPGGAMFVITERPSPSEAEAARVRARTDLGRLSRRECQIVTLMVVGWPLGEIAERLQIAKGTVKNYRLAFYRKLGISSERTVITRFWPLLDEFRKDPLVTGRPLIERDKEISQR